MKFDIGQKVSISGTIEITGAHTSKGGIVSYNTDHAFVIPEKILEQIQSQPCTGGSPEPAPKEGKPEPIKLYCVKELSAWLTVGKVYDSFDGWFHTDDGDRHTYKALVHGGYLFPLVRRPAKVGEWVYVTGGKTHRYKVGKIYKVAFIGFDDCVWFADDLKGNVQKHHYLVLDGYDGRYEEAEKPKYWSGDVICVDNDRDRGLTIGKKYSVIDGVVHWDNGEAVKKRFASFDDLHCDFSLCTHPKFIEYKGV